MSLFENYPYTNFHELNLDWIIRTVKQLDHIVDDFVAYNKITWAGTWDGSPYPAWTIVDDGNGDGYMSIKPVPANVPLSNTEYWTPVSNYTALYNAFDARISQLEALVQYVTPEDFGAVHDGVTDDTAAIQAAIDTGKPVLFERDAEYSIDLVSGVALNAVDGMELDLNGATLHLQNHSYTGYTIFSFDHVSGVTVKNGTLYGDKDVNTATTTEWCYGMFFNGCAGVRLQDLTIKYCSGDGIEFGLDQSSDIYIERVTCDNNGRNGMSMTNVRDVFVTSSKFNNSNGHNPQAGVDLEPNSATEHILNVHFDGCEFAGNHNAGFMTADGSDGDSVVVTNSNIVGSFNLSMTGAGGKLAISGATVKPYAATSIHDEQVFGRGCAIQLNCGADAGITISDVVVDCVNGPSAVVRWLDVGGSQHQNVNIQNLKAVNGSAGRGTFTNTGAVKNSKIEIDVSAITLTEAYDFWAPMANEYSYVIQPLGMNEFEQTSGMVKGFPAKVMIATVTAGGNVNLRNLPPFGECFVVNKGTTSFGLIANKTIQDSTGEVTTRIDLPVDTGVKIMYNPVTDIITYSAA